MGVALAEVPKQSKGLIVLTACPRTGGRAERWQQINSMLSTKSGSHLTACLCAGGRA